MTNHLFDEIAAGSLGADRIALETIDGPAMTYGGLFDASARIANLLVDQGVEPGDRVAMQAEKCMEGLLLYLACIRAGAVFLPLNIAYTDSEVTYFLEDAEPRLVVIDPKRVEGLAGAIYGTGASLLTLGPAGEGSLMLASSEQSIEFENVERGPDDLAAILYTSGTTGRSKGAMLTHENLASNARVLVDCWRFGPDDVLIHALPIFHTHGLFVATNVALMAGAAMIFLPKFDPDQVLRALERSTVLMGVPTFYVRLLQHPGLTPEATRTMRLFISGSAPLLAETHRLFQERTGHVVLERYGMTETSMITSNPYDGDRVAGSVGFPLPGTDLRIVDRETAAELPSGEVGLIEVRGPNVFKGYWRNPDQTAEEFRPDGYFITGDLGRVDERGYVHIVGRDKDLVISGGYNVYPKEVEAELDRLDGVAESAVVGVAHPDLGEAVVAVVVAQEGVELAERSLIEMLATTLARYKQPKRIHFVAELPRNSMGKVQKNLLRQQFGVSSDS